MTKTITVSQLYEHVKNSNMVSYIDSERALIRMIKKMTEGKSATAIFFEFFDVHGKSLTFKVHLKNLEN
ncbi:hypothetical protein ES707_04984 [subsurface metagenome]